MRSLIPILMLQEAMSQSVPSAVSRALLAASTITVLAALAARFIGASWSVAPGIALLFIAICALFWADDRLARNREPIGLAPLIARARSVPKAIQLLILTLFVTSLFAFEMRVDLIPNRFGLLELLFPVLIGTVLFDLSGGFFTVVITALFAYFVFVPPRFSAIFEPGPEFYSLMAYALVAVVLIFFLNLLLLSTRLRSLSVAEWDLMTVTVPVAWRTQLGRRLIRREILLPSALVCFYALFWAIYGAFSAENGPHLDSLEAYAWGREFRMGYFKHPPFWAWVAGSWFLIFPKTEFWFYLLSELNAGLGLLGTWALMGRFRKGTTRDLALLLLLLTPFYQFNALRFNANTMLLSIWPWTMYFFVRSIEKPRILAAFLCGLLAGCAMLSKYFGLVLVGSCFIAALTHDNRSAYFRSAAPYVSVLICLLMLIPHVAWLVRDGFQPLIYLASKGMFEEAEIADSYFYFIAANILYFVIPIILVGCARWLPPRNLAPEQSQPVNNGPSFMTVLALAPFVLTLTAGVVGHTALAVPFGTPIFSLAPLALVLLVKPDERLALRLSKAATAGLMVGCAVVGPFLPYINLRWGHPRVAEPLREVAELALDIWERETGSPLRYVTGDDAYSLAATFYAAGSVSNFRTFNFRFSDWVTPQLLHDRGLLIICRSDAPSCLESAGAFRTDNTKEMEVNVGRTLWDFEAPARRITLILVPPEPT
jgi:hypothetical protein